MTEAKERTSWSGQFAFVLAAAASAIGLGNLWRFPYLAAQYGGGAFIVTYLLLAVTLGSTLMLSEIAIGRLTRESQLTAYAKLRHGWGFIGILGMIVSVLIVSYYCVIGGWVLRYFIAYCRMAFCGAQPMGEAAAESKAFFDTFIASSFAPFGYGMLFVAVTASVIVMGIKKGIERSNLVLMPALFLLAIALAVYVICLPDTGEGLRYCLVPSLDALRDATGAFSFAQFGRTVLGAMGQMFYSLSLAMGIMITYGSYMRKCDSIEKSVFRIEVCDAVIAILAGILIVPVVFMFAVKQGIPVKEAMNAGPGLMFVTLPKVFAMLGGAGAWVGLAFFALVIFAALTSAISLFEACVASFCDLLHLPRKPATFFTGALVAFLATFSALGYGPWRDITVFGQQFLDFFDFVTNSVLMPVIATVTCVFIGWFVGPEVIEAEVMEAGHRFQIRGFYRFMVKYFAPVLVTAILVSEVCRFFGWGGWRI